MAHSQTPNQNGFMGVPKSQNDELERREIRQGYRKLLDDLKEQKSILVDPSNTSLQETINRADDLFNHVQQPREAALDSHYLVQVADLGKKKAQALQTDFIRFQPSDFCERLKVAIGGDLDSLGLPLTSWKRLGQNVQPLFNKTPVLKYMCGSFERGEVCLKRTRTPKEREKDIQTGAATKPTQLSTLEDAGRGELTTAHVENVLKTLWAVYENQAEKRPLDFFEFVTHPTSFGQTVENIFYTSFLVRDGLARVSLDEDQLPVIEPIDKQIQDIATDTFNKNQVILNITPQKWKEIVSTFKIEMPLIEPVKGPDCQGSSMIHSQV